MSSVTTSTTSVPGVPAVLLEGRGEGPHQARPWGRSSAELPLGHRRAVHVDRVAVEQVLRRDVPVVEPQEGERLLGAHVVAARRVAHVSAARRSSSSLASSSGIVALTPL